MALPHVSIYFASSFIRGVDAFIGRNYLVADSAADGRILQLDMGVVGKEEPDAWLNAMRENLRKLRGETA